MRHEQPEEQTITSRFWGKLSEIAEKILRRHAPDPRTFADIYSSEEIERDLAALAAREQSFVQTSEAEKHLLEMSQVLEAIIFEQSRANKWFGDAILIKTSRFDDVKNGVDVIVEFPPQADDTSAEHMAVAIDVTFNEDVEREKLGRILAQIDSGDLAHAKYVHSPYVHGAVEAPEIILGVDRAHVQQIAEEWSESMDTHTSKSFAEHPVRTLLITQALEQCRALSLYAAQKGNTKAEQQYARAGELLAASLVRTGWERRNIDPLYETDEVHHGLMRALARLPKKEQPATETAPAPRRRIIVPPKKNP